ncbi:MAG: ATP-binding protein [Chloroflexota bacterium]
MQTKIRSRSRITDLPLSLLAFAILLFYTYGIFAQAPYIGFYFNPSGDHILEMYVPTDASLQVGDILVKVGDVSLAEFHADSRLALFSGDMKQGDILPITVQRNGAETQVRWPIPGFNLAEFFGRFFNIWWLAWFFWFMGSLVERFMRPREIRWRLLIAANHLTGLWLILGSFSAWQMWASSPLFHAITWLILPVYLHLHWIFPQPLARLPKFVGFLLYAAAIPMFVGDLIQALPRHLYAFALILALAGSVILQIAHLIWRPEQRRQVGLLAGSTLLAALPAIVLAGLRIFGDISRIAPAALLALPFMPAAYFYLIFRNRLGGLELRAHRILSMYAFLILAGTVILALLTFGMSLQIPGEAAALIALVTPLLAAAVSILTFPAFQAFMEQNFLGIKLPYQNLQETYSNRITASASTGQLLRLLEDEVFPSLLIRQFAFLQVANGKLKTLLAQKVTAGALPTEDGINHLVERSGKYIPNFSSDDEWTRLILPLKVGDAFIGFWLLGRRDPDDLYPLAEIPILQSIANQTAIALSNILQTEQLRKMYQFDIERNERERKRLALELHDSVLNQLAVLRNNLGENNLSPKFESAYEELTQRLREIVSSLRPPMLMYGLKPAIEELADNLMERSGDKVRIQADLEASEERVPEHMEQHLFRIVQEACENSLRHADAKTISIYGSLTPGKVDLNIHDDGKGFEADSKLAMDNLMANRHFGLAGMIERAYLIGAEIKIHSRPNTGARIHITWVEDRE